MNVSFSYLLISALLLHFHRDLYQTKHPKEHPYFRSYSQNNDGGVDDENQQSPVSSYLF